MADGFIICATVFIPVLTLVEHAFMHLSLIGAAMAGISIANVHRLNISSMKISID